MLQLLSTSHVVDCGPWALTLLSFGAAVFLFAFVSLLSFGAAVLSLAVAGFCRPSATLAALDPCAWTSAASVSVLLELSSLYGLSGGLLSFAGQGLAFEATGFTAETLIGFVT